MNEVKDYLNKNLVLDYFRNVGEFQNYVAYLVSKFYGNKTEVIFDTPSVPYEDLPTNAVFTIRGLVVVEGNQEKIPFNIKKVGDQLKLVK